MKNRAIWVALGVTASAALLMFFVVLPQMRDGSAVKELADKAGEQIKEVHKTVNQAAEDVAKVATDSSEAVKEMALEKMGRIKSETRDALDELDRMTSTSSLPSDEELAAAKAKLKESLTSAISFEKPNGLDDIAGNVIKSISENGQKALALVESMPTDRNGIRKTLVAIRAALGEAFGYKPGDIQKSETKVVVPAFDVLRVEPDGNTVIAGRAEPGSTLDVIDSGEKIASVVTTPSGDFAAILDKPLAEGDHQIVLQAKGADGTLTTSEEVATVSVPKDDKGDLLAMVSKPGEASRIIAVPEADTPPETQETARADDSAPPVNAASQTEPAPDVAVQEDKSQETAASQTTTPAEGQAVAEKPSASATETAQKATKDAVTAPTETAATAPQSPETQTQQTALAQPGEAAKSETTPGAKVETATKAVTTSTRPTVSVSAVEIEGDRIFVAGNAPAGSVLRIYADDKLVAEVRADEEGRFLADRSLKLDIGEHTIRADLISGAGKVVVRASVPFYRPEGEQLAAVADDADGDTTRLMQPLANGSYDRAREEARRALALLKGLYANDARPTAEEVAAARSSTEIALKSLSEMRLPSHIDPAIRQHAAKASAEAANALASLKALPANADAVRKQLETIEQGVASAIAPVMQAAKSADDRSAPASTTTEEAPLTATTEGETVGQKKTEQASADPAAAKSETASNARAKSTTGGEGDIASQGTDTEGQIAANDPDAPEEIRQTPLTQSENKSVIIRKGDTLWQISRRVYGQGVRYTTIYLANRDQIQDPDRIRPGQVFGIPEKALDDAESEHRKRMQHEN